MGRARHDLHLRPRGQRQPRRGAPPLAARRGRCGGLAPGRARHRRRRGDAARPVERRRGRAHGPRRRAGHRAAGGHPSLPRRAASPRSARPTRRPCGWSAPSATSTAWSPKARPTPAPGSTTAAGACASRSARREPAPAAGDAYAFRRRGPAAAPDPRRAGACRHHRARPFPLPANGETVVRLEERLGYVHKGIDGLMLGAPLEQGGEARGPRLRRQHGRLCDRLRARGGGGARPRAAAARGLAARADGGARAPRQPFRRHRRHLQRRLVLAHARALRHPARAGAARRRRLLRPPPDDGPRRAGRRCGRSRQGRRRGLPTLVAHHPPPLPRAGRALRQHRLAAEPHRRHRHPERRARAPVRRRRLRRPRLGPRLRCPQGAGLRALHDLRFEVPVRARRATSMRACGCASSEVEQ